MEINDAVAALSALAQETRLSVFRYLVKTGPQGAIVGDIRDELDIPNATLSFHLATLKHAGLVLCRREGRRLFYCAHYDGMRDLLQYLTEDCCGGRPEICPVPTATARRRVIKSC
jgi:DNA-binding transcriptional ArsR family regulator